MPLWMALAHSLWLVAIVVCIHFADRKQDGNMGPYSWRAEADKKRMGWGDDDSFYLIQANLVRK
jgi:hypothetical protein